MRQLAVKADISRGNRSDRTTPDGFNSKPISVDPGNARPDSMYISYRGRFSDTVVGNLTTISNKWQEAESSMAESFGLEDKVIVPVETESFPIRATVPGSIGSDIMRSSPPEYRGFLRTVGDTRTAERALAQALFPLEHELNHERAELVRTSISRSLTSPERQKLAFIEWKLDRIEDARIGPSLDILETTASGLESLSERLDRLIGDVNERWPSATKPRSGGRDR